MYEAGSRLSKVYLWAQFIVKHTSQIDARQGYVDGNKWNDHNKDWTYMYQEASA